MTSLETLHLQLDQINAAISIVLTGATAEYKLNDMQVEQWVKYLTPEQLMAMRDDTELKIDLLTDQGGCYIS